MYTWVSAWKNAGSAVLKTRGHANSHSTLAKVAPPSTKPVTWGGPGNGVSTKVFVVHEISMHQGRFPRFGRPLVKCREQAFDGRARVWC